MKSEPLGCVKFNKNDSKRLGLENVSQIKLELIAATILAKSVTPCEAALTCLQTPIIRKSEQVVYIDSKPPKMRSRSINFRSRTFLLHPIGHYMNRLIKFKSYSFKEYYKAYEVVKTKYA